MSEERPEYQLANPEQTVLTEATINAVASKMNVTIYAVWTAYRTPHARTLREAAESCQSLAKQLEELMIYFGSNVE